MPVDVDKEDLNAPCAALGSLCVRQENQYIGGAIEVTGGLKHGSNCQDLVLVMLDRYGFHPTVRV